LNSVAVGVVSLVSAAIALCLSVLTARARLRRIEFVLPPRHQSSKSQAPRSLPAESRSAELMVALRSNYDAIYHAYDARSRMCLNLLQQCNKISGSGPGCLVVKTLKSGDLEIWRVFNFESGAFNRSAISPCLCFQILTVAASEPALSIVS
jgi:hypothetical protein